MSRAFSAQKLRGEQRRNVIQAVQKRIQAEALEAVRRVVTDLLETEVTVKLGREKGMRRQVSEQGREIDWQCHHCGCRDAQYFTRDGHYRPELQTGSCQVQNLQVPMVECQKCQHDVVCEYAILEKHHRFWLDLDQDVLWSSGCCQSLREISERWSASLGRTVGLRTVNERINQVERLVNTYHEQPFEEAPDVVQLDGIWLTLQQETGAVRSDKRQRTRPEKQGKRVVVLVALGFWQHGGKQEIIDWQIATSEGHTEWESFLTRLTRRGVTAEKGRKRDHP